MRSELSEGEELLSSWEDWDPWAAELESGSEEGGEEESLRERSLELGFEVRFRERSPEESWGREELGEKYLEGRSLL